MHMKDSVSAVAELASDQGGMITSGQARRSGVTLQQLKRMSDSGVIERLHHGIYRLTRIPADENQRLRAAWLALDPNRPVWERLDEDVPTGVVSHRSAAALQKLGDLDSDTVELSTLRRVRLNIPAVRTYRADLSREDWTVVDGLPVTTPARTIADLAGAKTDRGHLATVVRDAIASDRTTSAAASNALAPHAFDYGLRVDDGRAFFDELVEEAGVSQNVLDLAAAVTRRQSSVGEPMDDLSSTIAAAVLAALSPQFKAAVTDHENASR